MESQLTTDFLNHLKFEKRFSEKTAKLRGTDLKQFAEFLIGRSKESAAAETQPSVDQLLLSADVKVIKAYITFLNEKQYSEGKKYSKAAIAQKLATLRSFYKFLVKGNQLSSSPVTVSNPKVEKKLPRIFVYEEVKTLLETPSMDNMLGARDRAILETLYSTGIRVSELVALNLGDLDFLGEVVHVRGKGKKERIAPIGSSALQVIQHYMEFISKLAQSNPDFDTKVLFVNKNGKRLNTDAVRKLMKKYLKIAGMDMTLSPRVLRDSFGVHMINNGADLRSVQELLGHQSMETVKLYEKLADQLRKGNEL